MRKEKLKGIDDMADKKEDLILVDKASDGIATITINRPHALNALTRDMLVTLAATFRELDQDRNVKIIILTGAGRAFSAGVVSFLSFPLRCTQLCAPEFLSTLAYILHHPLS